MVKVKSCTRRHNVDQMVRHIPIFLQILPRPDIHAAIYLSAIRRQDLGGHYTSELPCQLNRIAGLSGGGGTENDDKVDVAGEIFI